MPCRNSKARELTLLEVADTIYRNIEKDTIVALSVNMAILLNTDFGDN